MIIRMRQKSNTKLYISNKKTNVSDKDNIQKNFTLTKQNNNEFKKVIYIYIYIYMKRSSK